MELYIIRHAQSTNNARGEQRDRDYDPPLTELGKRQAEIVAQHLATGTNPKGLEWKLTQSHNHRGYGITKLYCSPMWRSLQTAQPIGQALGLDPEGWIDIHEQGGIFLDHGEEGGIVGYPGKTRLEILAEFPNYVLPKAITDKGWWNQGYEDGPTSHGRAIKVAEELRRRATSEERIAIVSHGGFIDALIKALLSQLPSSHLFYYHYNTAITRIDFFDGGYLRVRYMNRIDHLPPEMISY